MLTTMGLFDFAARLVAAVVRGAVIGVERQRRHSLAGMRTNALVAAGASQFVMISALVQA